MFNCVTKKSLLPSNFCKRWTLDEETKLIVELDKGVDIKTIAHNHNRTLGGIYSRRNKIIIKDELVEIKRSIEELKNITKKLIELNTKPKKRRKLPQLPTEKTLSEQDINNILIRACEQYDNIL